MRLTIFSIFSLVFLASCEDCKDCTGTLVTNIDGEYRETEILPVKEFCEDDLADIEGKRLVKSYEVEGHKVEEITIYDCIKAD